MNWSKLRRIDLWVDVGRGGGGGGYSAEVQQFFDRLITPPSAARAALYAALIDANVVSGGWAKLDVLDVFAAADEQTSFTNLISASYLATLDAGAGSPIFTADRGWGDCGAPTIKDVNSNFNPSTAGGNYTRNDAVACAWQIGTTQENKFPLGDGTDSGVYFYPRWSDNNTYWRINGSTEIGTPYSGDPDGFWLMERTGANASAIYRSDVQIATTADASAALVNRSILSDLTLNKVAALALGGSLTSGQKTTLYSSLLTYLTAVGAV